MAEGEHQGQRIPDDVEEAERANIPVVTPIPTGGAPVAPLVGRNNVKACVSEGSITLRQL